MKTIKQFLMLFMAGSFMFLASILAGVNALFAFPGQSNGLSIVIDSQSEALITSVDAFIITGLNAPPDNPGPIQGPLYPCQGAAETYAVAQVEGVNYEWTLPDGWQLVGSNLESSVDVIVGSLSGLIQLIVSNDEGQAEAELYVSPVSMPVQPGTIAGLASPCEGTVEVYTVTQQQGVNYIWETPGTWTILSGQNTNEIEVLIGSAGGTLRVKAVNDCGESSYRSRLMFVSAMAAQPGPISGNTTPEVGSAQSYSVPSVPNQTIVYEWDLPAGWQIMQGQNTNSILVTVGHSPGEIVVTPFRVHAVGGGRTCEGPSRSLAVEPQGGAVEPPTHPGPIAGEQNPCINTIQEYNVQAVQGVSYAWSFPADWEQLSGGNGSAVTVNTGSSSGLITVIPYNAFGQGPASILEVFATNSPGQPGIISGPSVISYGQLAFYSIAPVAGATIYHWDYSGQGTISGSGTTIGLTATSSGNLSVTASNACGTGMPSALSIEVEGEAPDTENILVIKDAFGTLGQIITVEIEIINEEPFTGFQLNLDLPEGFTYVEGSIQVHREIDHFISAASPTPNSLNIISVSFQNLPFVGTDGTVATFDLVTPFETGNFPITAHTAIIVGSSGSDILTQLVNGQITLQAENVFQIHDAMGLAEQVVEINLEIRNEEAFSGFQADLQIPDGFNYLPGSLSLYRNSDHQAFANLLDNNILRIAAISINNSLFDGNEGIVASFGLIAGTQHGEFPLNASNVIIGNQAGNNILNQVINGLITISDQMPGDANCDGDVNILDVITIVNYILDGNPQPFCFENADVYGDGIIDILDAIGTINILMGKAFQPIASQTVELQIEQQIMSVVTDGTISGLQFELSGPAIQNLSLNILHNEMKVGSQLVGDVIRVVILHPQGEPFPAGKLDLIALSGASDLRIVSALAGNINAEKVAVHHSSHTDEGASLSVFPNPSIGDFTIEFELPHKSMVSINILDLTGELYLSQAKTVYSYGRHTIKAETKLPPALYFIEMIAEPLDRNVEAIVKHQKLIIMR